MRRVLFSALFPLMVLLPQQAPGGLPMVDLYGGALFWNSSISGDIAADGDDVDMEDDLGFDRERHTLFFLGLEHAVPFVPNARLRHVDMSDSARGNIEREFVWRGVTFQADEDVRSDYDFTFTDLSLYYSLPLPAVDVNAGLTVRALDMDARIRTTDGQEDESVEGDGVFPMLHGSAQAELPLTGFYAGGEANVVSYSGNSFRDGRVYLGWTSDFALGAELGYQLMTLKVDDLDGLDADIDKTGPYLGVSLRF